MVKLTQFSLFLIAVLVAFAGNSQNNSMNGRFNGKHFSVDDFGSSGQMWTGVQAKNGIVYFGNRRNILSYNGVEWGKVHTTKEFTPNPKELEFVEFSETCKLFRSSNDRIYVGKTDNFGYITYNDSGAVCYKPLFIEMDKTKSFNGIWNIFELDDKSILFIAEKSIFKVKNDKVERLKLPAKFDKYVSRTACSIGTGYLIAFGKAQSKGEKCHFLYIDKVTGKFKELFFPDHISIHNIRGSFELNGYWYILDISKKIYRLKMRGDQPIWNSPNENFYEPLVQFSANYIYRKGNYLYLGTEDKGLIVTDLSGKLVRVFDYYDELEDLNVFFAFHDAENNIWMCLDNGIQVFETSNPITFFGKNEGISSLPEALDFGTGKVIVGSHTDVLEFVQANSHTSFHPTNALNQQIFDLKTFTTSQGKKTIAVGYEGLYEYFPKTKTNKAIMPVYAYRMRQNPTNPDEVYCTIDGGIGKMSLNKNGTWDYTNLVTTAQGQTFELAICNNKIYFGITNVGVGIYNLTTNKLKTLTIKNTGNDNNNYYVQTYRGQVFVGIRDRIGIIQKDDKTVLPFKAGNFFLSKGGKEDIHRIININDEQLWITTYREINDGKIEFEIGWLEQRGTNWHWTKWPLSGMRKAGLTFSIEQGPNNEIWLGATNGLYVLNVNAIKRNRNKLNIFIDKFESENKVLGYNLLESKSPINSLIYKQNSFRITFHANSFSGLGNMEYRYKLEGYDDVWSEWSKTNQASFSKVSEGDYTILIQARNTYGIESELFRYDISILPPWYRTVWAYILYIVALVGLIYIVVQLSLQRVKRQNMRLEEIVLERTSEIAEQNHQLEIQKEEITEKTKDILDSIQYAKRIQTTILPSATRLNEMFKDHFVLYRPKDIVSGDFYWAKEIQGKMFFSAVDCTGHGVPGSLVSIVGNNGLLRAVNEFKLTEPHQILDKLREVVIEAFKIEGQTSDVKDGMDIALCSIDFSTGQLKYSGANNECVIIRGEEIIELKADKQPIGQFIDAKPFTQQEYQLEEGDCIYLYTDGYVDQFGGDKGKKFKSRPFKTMLSELIHLPMKQQYDEVFRIFEEWKGELEQIDDVCVFGVRYTTK